LPKFLQNGMVGEKSQKEVFMFTLQVFKRMSTLICILCTCFTFASSSLISYVFPPQYAIQMDSEGNMVAIWQEANDGSNAVIYASNRTFGGNWSNPQQISVGMYSDDPKLALSPSGHVVAVWRTRAALAPFTLYAATISLQGSATWTAPVSLSHEGDNVSDNFDVVVNSNNQAVISWNILPPNDTIFTSISTLTDGTNSWSTPVPANDPALPRNGPAEMQEPSFLQGMHGKLCDMICPSN
jgi:hypothetical protein